jgi:hypothetical protein
MGRKIRIESDDVLIIRTAPIFQPTGGRQHRLELDAAPDGQAHSQLN